MVDWPAEPENDRFTRSPRRLARKNRWED